MFDTEAKERIENAIETLENVLQRLADPNRNDVAEEQIQETIASLMVVVDP